MCPRHVQKRAHGDAPASGELQPGSTAGLEDADTVRDSDSNVGQLRISDMPSLDENRIRQICSEMMISVFNQWLKDERFVISGIEDVPVVSE